LPASSILADGFINRDRFVDIAAAAAAAAVVSDGVPYNVEGKFFLLPVAASMRFDIEASSGPNESASSSAADPESACSPLLLSTTLVAALNHSSVLTAVCAAASSLEAELDDNASSISLPPVVRSG
jgi:hypothetical protein